MFSFIISDVCQYVYFAEISAQLKTFVDRCYSYLEPFEDTSAPETSRIPPGKKMVLITARNPTDEMFGDVCDRYQLMFDFLGFKKTYLVRGGDLMKADALKTKKRNDLIELAEETAREVLTE